MKMLINNFSFSLCPSRKESLMTKWKCLLLLYLINWTQLFAFRCTVAKISNAVEVAHKNQHTNKWLYSIHKQ
jgi:hypothetical protein